MSLILDALKKSELDRQRAATPGFVAAPVTTRRSGLPLWAWLVGALLLVNVGVLTVLLWRNQRAAPAPAAPVARSTAPASTPAAAPTARRLETPAAAIDTAPRTPQATADASAAAPADHFSPMDGAPATAAAPVYAPEIPVEDTPRASAVPSPRDVAPLLGDTPRAVRRTDPTLNEPAERTEKPAEPAPSEEALPTLSELSNESAQGIPEIHLDVHVYAARPADRFVYINMRKYREGATLQEGPLLEHIRRDGAVLNYRGVRFLLPRQ